MLKGKWFDMIDQGIKKDEYRDLKKFWSDRLLEKIICDEREGFLFNIDKWSVKAKLFDVVEFQHGYSKDARRITIEFKEILVGKGKPEWGGSTEEVFIIKLGKILSRNYETSL